MNARRMLLAVWIGGVTAAALTVFAAGALAGGGDESDRVVTREDLKGVNFIESCVFSHRAPDDPIVAPGRPGASHDHSFVGNRTTSASSDDAALRRGSTSCERRGDTAAYWMPTLLVAGQPVAPLRATIYYRRKAVTRVSTFPRGLRMIAGNALASEPQDRRVVFWNCGVKAGVAPSSTPQSCPDTRGSRLRLHVTFPSCWDGRSLDSSDHQSHMAYPRGGRCPATHRVAVPAISMIYVYPVRSAEGVALASGGAWTGHADFINSWHQSTLQKLVSRCLNALRQCGRG